MWRTLNDYKGTKKKEKQSFRITPHGNGKYKELDRLEKEWKRKQASSTA